MIGTSTIKRSLRKFQFFEFCGKKVGKRKIRFCRNALFIGVIIAVIINRIDKRRVLPAKLPAGAIGCVFHTRGRCGKAPCHARKRLVLLDIFHRDGIFGQCFGFDVQQICRFQREPSDNKHRQENEQRHHCKRYPPNSTFQRNPLPLMILGIYDFSRRFSGISTGIHPRGKILSRRNCLQCRVTVYAFRLQKQF